LRFNAVGAAGIAVQLGTLALLKSGFGLHYLWATALAVEAAVLNNYFWHVRWTWRDRAHGSTLAAHLNRLFQFHLGNGAVSLVVNLALMRWLAGSLGMNYLAANILAIAAGGVANFLISDRLVFLSRRA
jgi:dolichol-phosphate mannosyltransferase